ncbi:CPBP family glutamic-type intramembrane protease [Paenibacillus tengchongensis]|uniref:CPBP family glutamic-type intramembrane protease n=1 Tax=Paenibacillus tengchongensis TaxID=2608684 RepID=UPI00124BE504|nr:CPBP family glutamic-type intramembrane protease [Paenibacillus tengchongensis]
MTPKSGLAKVWFMFTAFLLLFILNFTLTGDNPGPTGRAWLLLSLCSLLISIVLLVKNKLPSKRQILLSVLLAAAVALTYINLSLFSMIENSIITLFASMAALSTFNKYSAGKLVFLNTKNSRTVAVSLLIGVAAGLLLGIFNLMLMSNEIGEFSMKLQYFRVALSPAIFEEVALRTVFYALCLTMLNGRIETRAQRFTAWFMMIVPHALIHTPDSFIDGGIILGIVATLLLSLLFGLPFAILQRKRDITSAMLGHGIVDIIRFCFTGLPM